MAQAVTVACKLPNGLLIQNRDEKGVVTWQHAIAGVGIKRDPGTMLPREPSPILTPTGFALTSNVDADQFELWLIEHAEMDCVRNSLIFAHGVRKELEAEMKDNEDRKTGLEPLAQKARGIEKMKD